MIVTPYDTIDVRPAIKRILPLWVFIFLILSWISAAVASWRGLFRDQGPTAVHAGGSSVVGELYTRFARQLHTLPPYCAIQPTVNEFERNQCQHLWQDLGLTTFFLGLPFAISGLGVWLSARTLRNLLRRIRQQIRQEKRKHMGMRINQESPNSLFRWYFHLQSFPVTLKAEPAGKASPPPIPVKILQVHWPAGLPLPPLGVELALFSCGRVGGKVRYFAVRHIPHLAVIRGT